MPLDDLCSFGEMAEMIIGGWRYLVSSSYRQKKHREWREADWIKVFFEVMLGLAGIIVCIGLLAVALEGDWGWVTSP